MKALLLVMWLALLFFIAWPGGCSGKENIKEKRMERKSIDYSKLTLRLVQDFTWPGNYMFKFIIPFSAESLNTLKALFDDQAHISHRESSGGNYISFTAVRRMQDPDEVIAIYKRAEEIENIIAL